LIMENVRSIAMVSSFSFQQRAGGVPVPDF